MPPRLNGIDASSKYLPVTPNQTSAVMATA